jgi:hypothetical protein
LGKNLKTIKNQLAKGLGLALVLGLARVGARAEDTNSVTTPLLPPLVAAAKEGRPARPEKPKDSNSGKSDRPNITQVEGIISNFKSEKQKFIQDQKAQQAEQRGKVREELTSKSSAVGGVRHELKDSINDLKQQTQEHGRKLAEEAKQAAKDAARKRD